MTEEEKPKPTGEERLEIAILDALARNQADTREELMARILWPEEMLTDRGRLLDNTLRRLCSQSTIIYNRKEQRYRIARR